MKVRVKVKVKATGEIKEVDRGIYSPYRYVDKGMIYTENDVEELPGDDGAIFFDPTIDYWTRLEHQYAGMAMQGILAHYGIEPLPDDAANNAREYAHALVENMKEVNNG